jgi:hypothetical protein
LHVHPIGSPALTVWPFATVASACQYSKWPTVIFRLTQPWAALFVGSWTTPPSTA